MGKLNQTALNETKFKNIAKNTLKLCNLLIKIYGKKEI